MTKNQKLFSSLAFLGVFILIVFGILIGKGQNESPEPNTSNEVNEFKSQDGKIVLVEFSDFQCPACKLYYPLVEQLRKDYGDRLLFIYKHFPLKTIHRNAELAARASEAARIQGEFEKMVNLLFERQEDWASSSDPRDIFSGYAQLLNLDKDRFLSDLESDQVAAVVNKDFQKALELNLRGTPSFFVNGKKIENPETYDEFKSIIDEDLRQ